MLDNVLIGLLCLLDDFDKFFKAVALRVLEIVPLESSDVVLVVNFTLLVVNVHEVLGSGIESDLLGTVACSSECSVDLNTVLIQGHQNVQCTHFEVLFSNKVGMKFAGIGSLILECMVRELLTNLIVVLIFPSSSNNIENHIVF